MLLVIIAIICMFLFYLLQLSSRGERKTPPGMKPLPHIRGLPIIGIIHQIKPSTCLLLNKLGATYGPIFKVNFGMRPMVVINEYKTLKKALKDNADNFSGRMQFEGLKVLTHESGIVFEDGDKWAKQRSFLLKVLRDFGLGKSKSASIVEKECLYFLEELKTLEGRSVDFSTLIPVYTVNIISRFVMNKRYEREDPKLKVIEYATESITKKNLTLFLHAAFPILDGIGWFMKQTEMKKINPVHDIFYEEVQEHIKNLDMTSEGEDFIDRFLIEQKRLKEKTGSVETFTNWQLIQSSYELFSGGYETTSTTLCWSLMFMSKYPHIQNIVYNEIKDQIGEERLPNLNDRKSLNYTSAVMDEVFRISSISPLAVQHRVFNDCEINGYFVPKDSIVLPNIYACHFDANVWEKPNEFYPEHFLRKDDNGLWKYNAREELVPFGLGRRQCLGESLARMEYFLFFTSVIQRFHVRFTNELTDEQYKKVLVSNDGFIRGCEAKDFIFKLRQRE